MCFKVDNYWFTGDTYMPEYKSTIDKKKCSTNIYDKSISLLKLQFGKSLINICPGHGQISFQVNGG
jgi:glyoxylase-like metal-dependent hydrolase (beta-lactamase superfamily II)